MLISLNPVPGVINFPIYILKYVLLKKGYFLDYNYNTIILRQPRLNSKYPVSIQIFLIVS